jgi:hypothetical protein
MAVATEPTTPPAKPAAPGSELAGQRALVYSLTALLVVTSWVVAAAFRDPCAATPGMLPGMCKPTMAQRLPSGGTLGLLLSIQVVMVVFYELRWTLRNILVGLVGAAQTAIAIYLFSLGKPTLLVIACGLTGVALMALEYGVRKDRRAAWAFATVTAGVLTLIYFFASRRIEHALNIPLAMAVLPALGLLLPITVALSTSPPGAPRTRPFAR